MHSIVILVMSGYSSVKMMVWLSHLSEINVLLLQYVDMITKETV